MRRLKHAAHGKKPSTISLNRQEPKTKWKEQTNLYTYKWSKWLYSLAKSNLNINYRWQWWTEMPLTLCCKSLDVRYIWDKHYFCILQCTLVFAVHFLPKPFFKYFLEEYLVSSARLHTIDFVYLQSVRFLYGPLECK